MWSTTLGRWSVLWPDPGFDDRGNVFRFLTSSRYFSVLESAQNGSRPTLPSIKCVPACIFQRQRSREIKLLSYLQLVTNLRIIRTLISFPCAIMS
jgi:hypothetical protein